LYFIKSVVESKSTVWLVAHHNAIFPIHPGSQRRAVIIDFFGTFGKRESRSLQVRDAKSIRDAVKSFQGKVWVEVRPLAGFALVGSSQVIWNNG
jgi:hypothetical protein